MIWPFRHVRREHCRIAGCRGPCHSPQRGYQRHKVRRVCVLCMFTYICMGPYNHASRKKSVSHIWFFISKYLYLEDCSYCCGSSSPGDVNTSLYSVIAFLSLNGPFTLDIYGSVLNGTQSPLVVWLHWGPVYVWVIKCVQGVFLVMYLKNKKQLNIWLSLYVDDIKLLKKMYLRLLDLRVSTCWFCNSSCFGLVLYMINPALLIDHLSYSPCSTESDVIKHKEKFLRSFNCPKPWKCKPCSGGGIGTQKAF